MPIVDKATEVELVDIKITALKLKKIMLNRGITTARAMCPRVGCGGQLYAKLDARHFVHMVCQGTDCSYRTVEP